MLLLFSSIALYRLKKQILQSESILRPAEFAFSTCTTWLQTGQFFKILLCTHFARGVQKIAQKFTNSEMVDFRAKLFFRELLKIFHLEILNWLCTVKSTIFEFLGHFLNLSWKKNFKKLANLWSGHIVQSLEKAAACLKK